MFTTKSHIEDQNEWLRAENERLLAENKMLRCEAVGESLRSTELSHMLHQQRREVSSLAEANANAAELVAQLEEAYEHQKALAERLAEANANAAELMVQLEDTLHDLTRARDAERQRSRELLSTQQSLREELDAAVHYVRSLLPVPTAGPVRADWRFLPSADLGGDAFGYHWVDGEHFAFYLLDVCGHGLAATLVATSVLSALRTQRLSRTDFCDPSQVMSALNDAFPNDAHGGMFFSAWYGVYEKTSRSLRYTSAGHPPALLLGDRGPVELTTEDTLLGLVPGASFDVCCRPVEPGSEIYVFSDGVYEIERPDGSMLAYEDFLKNFRRPSPGILDQCLRFAHQTRGAHRLDDDYSMLGLRFG